MDELKQCPFCGKSVAEYTTVCDCECCANFEEEDCPECYEPTGRSGCIHFVVCSVHKGGCGASTGWCLSKEKAMEAWNRRTSNGSN